MEFVDLIKVPKLDGVLLHDHMLGVTVEGTLCITGHHVLLSTRQEDSQELWLLHKAIDAIEKKPFLIQNSLTGGLITLKCKDLRIISLEINFPDKYVNVAASLEALSALRNPELEYPFFYRPTYTIFEDGHTMFKPELEFKSLTNPARNTLCMNSRSCNLHVVNCEWRLSYINVDYKLCPTYGPVLIVPQSITDEQIKQSATFRDGGRFPVLSYNHRNGAALLRSAQPLPMTSMKRCRADEAILNVVLGRSKKGFIIDTWTKSKSNKEIDQHYSQWRKINRAIGNISSPLTILDSFTKLIEACNDTNCTMDKWLSRLENSSWLSYVLNCMNAACVVAQCLDKEGSPVLVHGSKGLDSTLIVTSLTQIILNPDCRTLRGIQALLEREWIQAGFPFASRHLFSCYAGSQNRSNSGSTFILFLDCVHQLFKQFPCSFEFNLKLLNLLFEHSQFSQYGTFLCDSEMEREKLHVRKRTISLWSYLNRPDVIERFLNPLYEPNPNVIWPSVAPISLELWNELYLHWSIINQSHGSVDVQIKDLLTRKNELRSKVLKLRKEATDLAKEVFNLLKMNNQNGNENHCDDIT